VNRVKRGYYQFAGPISSAALAAALAAGAGTAAFIAFVYANAQAQLAPLESITRWLELAVTPVMALLAAAATGATLHAFKVRSRVAMTLAVLGATAGAIAISWQMLEALHTEQVGVAGVVIDGAWLMLLQASSALIVVAAALAVTNVALDTPLCPYCKSWCARHDRVARIEALPARHARALVEAGDWPSLRRLGRPRGSRYLRFDIAECSVCGQTRALSVTLAGRLGRRTPVVRNLLINGDTRRTIESL